jgi:hypothetical protein
MKTVDLIEKSKRELEEFNLFVAEFDMRIKKENPSREEYEKNVEDFHALNKQKKNWMRIENSLFIAYLVNMTGVRNNN